MLDNVLKTSIEKGEDQEVMINMREKADKEMTEGNYYFILEKIDMEMKEYIVNINPIDRVEIEIERMTGTNTPPRESIKDHQDPFLIRLQKAAIKREEIIRKRRIRIEDVRKAELCDV